MKSVMVSFVLPMALAIPAFTNLSGHAFGAERDQQFFHSVQGDWVGPGEIVAGKYKGTKFTCSFTGTSPEKNIGMTFDGSCRVGVFSQKMSATVERKGRDGYKGSFMGGASGSGLDIISGNVVNPNKVVFAIHRKQLRGVMQASMKGNDSMIVTISVRVEEQAVPVIGMNLKRVDAAEVGSIAPN